LNDKQSTYISIRLYNGERLDCVTVLIKRAGCKEPGIIGTNKLKFWFGKNSITVKKTWMCAKEIFKRILSTNFSYSFYVSFRSIENTKFANFPRKYGFPHKQS